MELAGVQVDDYEITEAGVYRFKCQKKRARLTPHEPIYFPRSLSSLLDIIDQLNKYNIELDRIEKPLLAQWILNYLGCSRTTAYRYASFLKEITARIKYKG